MTSNDTRNSVPTTANGLGDFRLEMLELLPCGCVVAVQRLAQSGVRVVSMEAKGPHCPFPEHRANKVIRLGEPDTFEDYDEELSIRVA